MANSLFSYADVAMSLLCRAKQTLVDLLTAIFAIILLVGCSISVYKSLYFLYMPGQTYDVEVNFKFKPCELEVQQRLGDKKCSFPAARLAFHDEGGASYARSHYLMGNQKYSMALELDLKVPDVASPDAESRGHQSFMVCITLMAADGKPVSEDGTTCLSTVLTPKSGYARFVDFILTYPLSVVSGVLGDGSLSWASDRIEQKTIEFHRYFKDDIKRPAVGVFIEVQDIDVDPIRSRFRIHRAHLDSLSHVMYYHPSFSMSCGCTIIAVALIVGFYTAVKTFSPGATVKLPDQSICADHMSNPNSRKSSTEVPPQQQTIQERRERAKNSMQTSYSQNHLVRKINDVEVELEQNAANDDVQDFVQVGGEEGAAVAHGEPKNGHELRYRRVAMD